jgi:hemophore-related protein
MMRLSLSKLAAGFGGIAIALSAAAGVASADPMDQVVNTTCTYDQVINALNAIDPANAAKFSGNSMASGLLQDFLNSGPAERAQKVQQIPPKYVGVIQRVAAVCNRY